jgi:hypothetical protein
MSGISKEAVKRALEKGDYSLYPKPDSSNAEWWSIFDRTRDDEGKILNSNCSLRKLPTDKLLGSGLVLETRAGLGYHYSYPCSSLSRTYVSFDVKEQIKMIVQLF